MVWGLCCLLCVGLITSAGLAFQSMDDARKDLQTIADRQSEASKTAYLRFVKYFLAMQMSIVAILVSICVWLVLTVVEIARKKVGISIVLVATFYTMLMLLTHGISLQFNQQQTADFVVENFGGPNCPASLIPKLCAFDKKDVEKYEATYYLSYVCVGMLAMYAAFLVFIRRVEEGGSGSGGGGIGGRYAFKSPGLGAGVAGGGGMATQMEEYQGGGAEADASPWRQNTAYT